MADGGDFNFSVDPKELDERGFDILRLCKEMSEAIDEFEDSLKGLESWRSDDKDKYDAKFRSALPHMHEMVEVIESYGKVARKTANNLVSTESFIAKQLD